MSGKGCDLGSDTPKTGFSEHLLRFSTYGWVVMGGEVPLSLLQEGGELGENIPLRSLETVSIMTGQGGVQGAPGRGVARGQTPPKHVILSKGPKTATRK